MAKSISQTGTTKFKFQKLDILIEANLFVPVGMLKKMRREVLAGLENEILSKYRRNCVKSADSHNETNSKKEQKQSEMIVSVMKLEQLQCVLELNISGLKKIYIRTELLNAGQLKDAVNMINSKGIDAYIVMPHIFRKNVWEKQNFEFENECAGYVIKNFEEFTYLTKKCGVTPEKIVTDAQMYTMNGDAVRFWRENGVERFTMPFELTMYEMDELADTEGCEFIMYTHIPMMVSAQCIRHNIDECAALCKDKNKMNDMLCFEDRKKRKFMAINYCKYCYNIIYKAKPLYLKKYEEVLLEKGISSFRYDFTFEDCETIKEILCGRYRGDYDEGHMLNGVE